ncbi:cytidylyltransferase domain-containing protein [Chloroflexota bacterium]
MNLILGVIPARGGSKGVPRKNLVNLSGKPLIAYTIEAGLQSQRISRVIVSTDDEEIASVSRNLGAEVPFLRPVELATDSALSLPVMQHAIREVEREEGRTYDIAVMLQPTTPLRLGSDIDAGIELLLTHNADSVISVVTVGAHHPLRMKQVIENDRLVNYVEQGFEDMRPRQQLPPVYIRNGALYITRRDVLLEQNSFVGDDCRAYIMPEDRSANIDSQFDFLLAEYLLKNI